MEKIGVWASVKRFKALWIRDKVSTTLIAILNIEIVKIKAQFAIFK